MTITRLLTGLAIMAGTVLAQDTITLQINGTSCSAQAWSFGAGGATAITSTPSSSKTQVSNLVATRKLDACSVNLFKEAVTAERLATLVLTQQDANKAELIKLTLQNVVVSNYQVAGDTSNSQPVESVAFSFTKITVETTVQQPNGTSSTIEFSWDLLSMSAG